MSNSPEQIDGLPEQFEEESVKTEEETSETPASPEAYDEAEWNRLKQGGPAFAINKGREMGVPQEELDRFAQDVIAREIENQNYGVVYRFRKNMGIGTEEEVKATGEQAYRFFLESGHPVSALAMAEDVYGRDSEEWRRVNETKEEEKEDEEQELTATISKDATFADLFNAIDPIEEFEEELVDLDSELAREVFAFRDEQESKASTTKVLDFFEERGYSQDEISIFLPIKFE